jgi:glucose/mannose-6-phosphate isomerase
MSQNNPTQSNLIDSLEKIQTIDKQNVLGSIEALADQIRQAWQETQALEIKLSTTPSNITVAGMGGSALGADVIKHAFKDELTVPFNIINDYTLPGYINENSLVILSSYSGGTEEVLSCAQQAQEKKAQVLFITQGGELAKFAQENNYQGYIIKPDYNPSDQPRMAIGYAIVGLMGLLNKAKLISIKDKEIEQIVEAILTSMHQCSVEKPVDENPAKTMAYTLVDRRPNLIAAEFLTGAAHVACNQFNENSKTFANYYQIPEINHHLLEGLKLPFSNKNDNFFVFFNSKLYHFKNQKRMSLTQEAVDKYEIETMMINLKSETKLTQIFELITLMAYANFYLSILNKINPSEIPIVDWFKEKLTE